MRRPFQVVAGVVLILLPMAVFFVLKYAIASSTPPGPTRSLSRTQFLRLARAYPYEPVSPPIDPEIPVLIHARDGDAKAVGVILDSDPGAVRSVCEGRNGWDAMYFAVRHGHLDVVKVLILHGADVTQKNPLFVLFGDEYRPVGPDSQVDDLYMFEATMGPLSHKVVEPFPAQYEDIFDLLVKAGADPNSTESWSLYTPLHYAVRSGDPLFVKKLLELGADPDARTREGEVPLHLAIKHGNYYQFRITELLIDAGADTDVLTRGGSMLEELVHSRMSGNPERMKRMLAILEKGR